MLDYDDDIPKPHERSEDRILVLRRLPGKTAKAYESMYTGEGGLHAIRGQYNHWSLKYKGGVLPGAFKQKFTSFPELIKFVEKYFEKRGLYIAEVKD